MSVSDESLIEYQSTITVNSYSTCKIYDYLVFEIKVRGLYSI